MSKEVKRYVATRTLPAASEWNSSTVPHTYVRAADYEALLAERDALRNDHGSMRNALKNARYRIEQGRVWNGMGWTLTGLHAHQQQKALDEIDAALQGEQP